MGTFDDHDAGFWRRSKKIKPGDGHPLQPFRWWQLLGRSLFYAPLQTDEGAPLTYAVSVDYFDWDEQADVYLNGKHHARAALPAAVPVEGGTIEIATTMYGLKRMHFVDDAGNARVLQPDAGSAEGFRAKLAHRKPALSRAIGVAAIVILVVSLPIGLLQIVEFFSHTDMGQNLMDPFTSPVNLPEWASTPLVVLGVAAALERALTLRNHWLIDLGTGWFE